MTTTDHQDSGHAVTYRCGPDEPLSRGVIEAVAEAADVAPMPDGAADGDAALEPLYDAVDPEALDAVFRPLRSNTGSEQGRITFSYAGCEVTAGSDGWITVRWCMASDGTPN
ncbi:HalOD1 output domain-containing protein [Natronoarchaeum mannanilyticum]|uniref:Halobacterial output domain-containing protein n=1 Tax=Natronoarchaeum mannanilyticum TaxID=926360 RepID=A0AAV3T5D2_9EURY